jgi:uncharacterized protein YkwD
MLDFAAIITAISSLFVIPDIGLNFLDVIIIIIVLFYAYEGYSLGFVVASLDLASFITSFIVALKLYSSLAQILVGTFSLPIGFANAGGFFAIALITEIFLSFSVRRLMASAGRIPSPLPVYKFFKKTDHLLGILPGVFSAFIILSFIFSVLVSLPTNTNIKSLVTESKIGGRLIANTSVFENRLNDVFGGALSETLNFLTVRPQSDESVKLNFRTEKGKVDPQSEQEMFELVNEERKRAGVAPLVFDNSLRDVARAHSSDMFERGYFSHYTPEGKSPFDRMSEFGIDFTFAGENLALAPSTDLAMQGLMNSLGHRKNILSPNFGKIGIGVIDGGIYGKMYSQEFTD